MGANVRKGIVFRQPQSANERCSVALKCRADLNLTIPMLIDRMSNWAAYAYDAWPDRLFIVGSDGPVAFKGRRGPRGFVPLELERALKRLLDKEQQASAAPRDHAPVPVAHDDKKAVPR